MEDDGLALVLLLSVHGELAVTTERQQSEETLTERQYYSQSYLIGQSLSVIFLKILP